MTPAAAAAPLIAVQALASSIWVGGLVAIFVVARVADATLEPAQRVSFFRALGRSYGVVGGVALLVALAGGAILLRDHPWDAALIASAVLAVALLVATAAGVVQARAMTRLRQRLLARGDAALGLDPELRRGALLANALRAAIAALTLLLLACGAILAS